MAAEAIVESMLAGVKLAAFTMFLVYTYLAQRASDLSRTRDMDLSYLYGVTIPFILVALAEFVFVLGSGTPLGGLFPAATEYVTLRVFNAAMYLVAGVCIVLFLRDFRRRLDEGDDAG